jgi:hypothetical protein
MGRFGWIFEKEIHRFLLVDFENALSNLEKEG